MSTERPHFTADARSVAPTPITELVITCVVEIGSPKLGRLVNRTYRADEIEKWSFGTLALMRNLKARGL